MSHPHSRTSEFKTKKNIPLYDSLSFTNDEVPTSPTNNNTAYRYHISPKSPQYDTVESSRHHGSSSVSFRNRKQKAHNNDDDHHPNTQRGCNKPEKEEEEEDDKDDDRESDPDTRGSKKNVDKKHSRFDLFGRHKKRLAQQETLQQKTKVNQKQKTKDAIRSKHIKQMRMGVVILLVGIFTLLWFFKKKREREKYPDSLVQNIKYLIRVASQNTVLSEQDQNLLIGLMHTNYAISYINMAKSLIPSQEIERITQIDLMEMTNVLESQQRALVQKIIQLAPNLRMKGMYAHQSGWLPTQ